MTTLPHLEPVAPPVDDEGVQVPECTELNRYLRDPGAWAREAIDETVGAIWGGGYRG